MTKESVGKRFCEGERERKWDTDEDRQQRELLGDAEAGCQYDVFVLLLISCQAYGSRWPGQAGGRWETSHREYQSPHLPPGSLLWYSHAPFTFITLTLHHLYLLPPTLFLHFDCSLTFPLAFGQQRHICLGRIEARISYLIMGFGTDQLFCFWIEYCSKVPCQISGQNIIHLLSAEGHASAVLSNHVYFQSFFFFF